MAFTCRYTMPMGGGKEGVAPPEYRQLQMSLDDPNPTKSGWLKLAMQEALHSAGEIGLKKTCMRENSWLFPSRHYHKR